MIGISFEAIRQTNCKEVVHFLDARRQFFNILFIFMFIFPFSHNLVIYLFRVAMVAVFGTYFGSFWNKITGLKKTILQVRRYKKIFLKVRAHEVLVFEQILSSIIFL